MLPKNRRISRKEFGNILGNSKRYHSPGLSLYIAKIASKKTTPSKFSFSVSKRVCKGAVDRNRLRRLGYSVVEKYINNIKEGAFFLFVFKKEGQYLDFTKLEKEIHWLLSDSGMLI